MKKKSSNRKKKCPGAAAANPEEKRIQNKKARLRKRLTKMQENDPKLRLPKFVERVNEVAEKFFPQPESEDGRVKAAFNGRKVRHYQAKGIIDSPEKDGKQARYGFRHLLQALLLRRLLAEGYPAARIQEMMAEKPNAAIRRLLVQGPEVALATGDGEVMPNLPEGAVTRGPWLRLSVAPGLEVHLARGFRPPEGPEAHREMMQQIGQSIREAMRHRRERRRARHG